MDNDGTLTTATTTGLGIDYTALANLDIEAHERALCVEALRRAGSVRSAAVLLKISRFALGRRLEKFGIEAPDRATMPRQPRQPRAPKPEGDTGEPKPKRTRKPKAAPIEQVDTAAPAAEQPEVSGEVAA